jgi:hypothetical protein
MADRRSFRLQLRNHLIDFAARLADLGVELLVQTVAGRLLALAKRIFPLAHPDLGRFQRLALAGGEALLVFEGAQVVIDLRQVFGKLRLARADVLTRGGHHRRVQSEPRRDLERQAPAGRSIHELIGRGECLRLEAERRAGHPRGCRRVGLERVVMTGCDDRRSTLSEVVDDGDAERAAFDRVGTRSDLVQQQQGRHRQVSIHGRDVRDSCRERAQTGVDRLLVADVGEERAEDRQPRPFCRRHVKPRLRHDRQQSGCFQRNRLAARVGTGDQQAGGRRDDLDGDRNRAFLDRAGRAGPQRICVR